MKTDRVGVADAWEKKCVWMLFLFRLDCSQPRRREQSHRRVARWFMDFPAEKHRVALVGTAIVWGRRGRRQGRTSGVIRSFTLLQEKPRLAENDVIERRNKPSLKFKQAAAEEADPPGSFLPPYWRTTWKKTRLYKNIVRLDQMAKCRRILAESADCLSTFHANQPWASFRVRSEWITAPKASSSSLEVSSYHVEKRKCASSEISESMEPSNVQKSAQIFWNPPRGGFIHQLSGLFCKWPYSQM